MARKLITGGLEFAAKLTKVVDLAVEDNPVSGGGILHGLVPLRREVDDGKACVCKAKLAISVGAGFYDDSSGIVWAAMRKRLRGIFEDVARNTSVLTENAKDAAHGAVT
jgi:hypothetical protein